jgi:hypothetical protein
MSFFDIILVFVFINIVIVLCLILFLNYRKVVIIKVKDFFKLHLQGNNKNQFSHPLPPPLPPPLPTSTQRRHSGNSTNISIAAKLTASQKIPNTIVAIQPLRPPPIIVTSTPEQKNKQNLLLLDSAIIIASFYDSQFSGFPLARFSEWYATRKCEDSPKLNDLISKVHGTLGDDSFNFDEVILRYSLAATYSQRSDLIYFCATSYNLKDPHAPNLRVKLLSLAQTWGLLFHELLLDISGQEAEEITQLEKRLEVDETPTIEARVAHLRRMHGFFSERLNTYSNSVLMDRRPDMISTYNVILEEHERLLEVYGFSP